MEGDVATSLLVVTTGALLMPAFARRLGAPVAITEIAFGLAVGRSGLGLLGPDVHEVSFVAGLGFALFLLLAGMEIDVADLVRRGVRAMALPVAAAGSALIGGLVLGAWIGLPAWLGLAAGVVSVPLAMAVLREADLTNTSLGRQVLLVAGIGELLSIGLIAAFDVGAGAADASAAEVSVRVARGFLPLIATLVVGVLIRTFLWWYPKPFMRFVASQDAQELGVRAGFALMFAGIVVTGLGGIDPLLGAFFAGLLVSYVVRDRRAIEHKLSGVSYGFFVPVFFVDVGARIEVGPSTLVTNAPLIAAILLIMLASRLVALVILGVTAGSRRESFAGALLLSSPLTLQIAVANLGARNGIFSPEIEGAIVLAAIIGGVVYPALARRLLGPAREGVPTA